MTEVDVVMAFMEAINQHDVDKLSELMAEDHVFVDSLGRSVNKRENMVGAWRNYFVFCPDYWVSPDEVFENGNRVAAFGAAGGTIASEGMLPEENKWRVPAAWLASIEKGLVKEWRVYADNKPVYDILSGRKT